MIGGNIPPFRPSPKLHWQQAGGKQNIKD